MNEVIHLCSGGSATSSLVPKTLSFLLQCALVHHPVGAQSQDTVCSSRVEFASIQGLRASLAEALSRYLDEFLLFSVHPPLNFDGQPCCQMRKRHVHCASWTLASQRVLWSIWAGLEVTFAPYIIL